MPSLLKFSEGQSILVAEAPGEVRRLIDTARGSFVSLTCLVDSAGMDGRKKPVQVPTGGFDEGSSVPADGAVRIVEAGEPDKSQGASS